MQYVYIIMILYLCFYVEEVQLWLGLDMIWLGLNMAWYRFDIEKVNI
jgi:hypothetical protein